MQKINVRSFNSGVEKKKHIWHGVLWFGLCILKFSCGKHADRNHIKDWHVSRHHDSEKLSGVFPKVRYQVQVKRN